jgi:hypothetical protein
MSYIVNKQVPDIILVFIMAMTWIGAVVAGVLFKFNHEYSLRQWILAGLDFSLFG